MRGVTLALLAGSLLALGADARAGVTIVQPGPEPDYTAPLQAAVDAAADGDILVLHGAWTPDHDVAHVWVDGKGLTIVAAAGTAPVIGSLTIRNVPAGSQMLVRGLEISLLGPVFGQETGLSNTRVDDCAGGVWFEDCRLIGYDGLGYIFGDSSAGWHGVSVHNSAAVEFVRCELTGGEGASEGGFGMGWHPATDGGDGVNAFNSKVVFRDCVLTGGKAGSFSTAPPPERAGEGVRIRDGSALLARCTLTGGEDAGTGSAPGSGLVVEGTAAVAMRETSATGGAGSPAVPPIMAPPGAISTYPAPVRSIAVGSPLHEQDPGILTVEAQPGDFVMLFTALDGGYLSLPGRQGVLSLGAPLAGPFVLGGFPGPGPSWDIPFVAPPLVSPSMQGFVTLLQCAVFDGTSTLLEGTTSFVLLDSTLP